MISFNSTINIYMLLESFTALGMFGFSGVLVAVMVCMKERDKARKYLFYIIMFLLALAVVVLWHSMSYHHADNVRRILIEAYKHPGLWGAN